MIIVEGPDGAGKSNLVKRLSATLGLDVEPRVVSKDTEIMGDLEAWVERDLASWPRPALYDRHRLISEPIYGPVMREQMQPGFNNQVWLQEMMFRFRQKGPMIIYCLPPIARVIENVRTGTDNVVVADKISQLYWLYFMAASRDMSSFIWDYSDRMAPQNFSIIQHAAYIRTQEALGALGGRS